MVYVPVARLRWYLLISVVNTILGFALFIGAFAVDQQIWIAIIALPVGSFFGLLSFWIANALRVARQA